MMVNATAHRATSRYPVILPLRYTTRYRAAVKAGVGWTRFLSVEGANVELDERLRPQTPLRLHLETDRGSIEVGAKVVWVGEVSAPAGGPCTESRSPRWVSPRPRPCATCSYP
jgi:hypothetical protein